MPRKITLGHLDISETGRAYVNDCLANNRLSYGKYSARFESEFARAHGCKHGIFMASGTCALQVSLAALKEVYGYQENDEVLVPATTFIATSNIVLQNGMKPVFVDVDPVTFNMDHTKIAEKITRRTRAIIPVHLFGLPADMIEIEDIATRFGLQIIEDSCETMFADQEGISVGRWGELAAFSTYVAHILVGGVGGILTTDDDRLARICRSLMAHGRDSIYLNIDQDDSNDDKLRREMIERRFKFDRVGYSYRCTELEAAIALSELEQYKDNIFTRRVNALLLTDLLRDLEDRIQLPFVPADRTHSFMMYPMVLRRGDRDDLLMFLEQNGIETRYLFPLLNQPVYQKLFPGEERNYPVAQHLAKQGFYVGMHKGLTFDDIQYMSDIIHRYFQHRYYA